MPQIQIPSPLRQYAGKQASVDVQGKTVGEALSGLVLQYPDLKRHLYTEDGKLRSFVNVYVNDEDMRYLQKEATSLKDGDTLSIVPSIAGGSPAFNSLRKHEGYSCLGAATVITGDLGGRDGLCG